MTRIATGNAPPPAARTVQTGADDIPHDAPDTPPVPTPRSDPLPQPARARLIALQIETDTARDAAASAQRRIDDLKRQLDYGDAPPEHAGSIEFEITRLQATRQAAKNRHQQLADLLAGLREYLLRLRSAVLEMGPELDVKPRDGEAVARGIERYRIEIDNTKRSIRMVSTAPLPKKILKAKAREFVEAQAAKGRPTLRPTRDGLDISFDSGNAFGPSATSSLPREMWLHKDAMIAALEAEVDALPETGQAMTVAERERRLADMNYALHMAERGEEALIRRAEQEGAAILRRPDASPAVVLNVQIARPRPEKTERVKAKAAT